MLLNLKGLQMNKKIYSPNYDEFYNWVTKGYFNKIKITRDKERIVKTNEIFTSIGIVMYGLDLAYPKSFFSNPDISYSDNCVGEGAWLVGMALKRMQAGLTHEQAIQNLKGADIMEDNIKACIERLLCGQEHLRLGLERNIICVDALQYHYRFDGTDPYLSDQDLHFDNLFVPA
jgi:hypothetical protein